MLSLPKFALTWPRRSGHAWLLLLSILLASGTARADVRLPGNASTARWLKGYSHAARLPPFGARGPEIRVWIESVMTGDLTGYAISGTSMVKCQTFIDVNFLKSTDVISGYVIKSAKCRSVAAPGVAVRALALLKGLSRLNHRLLQCGWQDGGYVLLEGTGATRRFVIEASNPGQCTDPGSRLVTKLLVILGE